MDIGASLKAVRKMKGLSQRELAKRAGVTNSTISMIEKNSVSPSVSSLKKVLAGIPMSLVEFFSIGDSASAEQKIVYRAAQGAITCPAGGQQHKGALLQPKFTAHNQ